MLVRDSNSTKGTWKKSARAAPRSAFLTPYSSIRIVSTSPPPTRALRTAAATSSRVTQPCAIR